MSHHAIPAAYLAVVLLLITLASLVCSVNICRPGRANPIRPLLLSKKTMAHQEFELAGKIIVIAYPGR